MAEAESAVREHTQRLDWPGGGVEPAAPPVRGPVRGRGTAAADPRLSRRRRKQQTTLLERRQRAGLRASACLEALTAFDLARRNNEANLEAAAQALEPPWALSGLRSMAARWPQLAEPCLDGTPSPPGRRGCRRPYPAILALEERLRGLEQQAALADRFGAGAHVDVYSAAGNDDSRDAAEYAVGVTLAVELPLGRVFAGGNSPPHGPGRGQPLPPSIWSAPAARPGQAVQALALFQAAATADVRFAQRRHRPATEAVRENTLRLALAGDQLDILQQSLCPLRGRHGLVEAAVPLAPADRPARSDHTAGSAPRRHG